jgi:hypothetical protein
MIEDTLSEKRGFLSPDPKAGHRPSEAIVVLKGELVALREEIGRLLTDEDRKKLQEKRRNRTPAESPRRVTDFDMASLSSSRGDVHSERAYQMRASGEGFGAEQIRHLTTEN